MSVVMILPDLLPDPISDFARFPALLPFPRKPAMADAADMKIYHLVTAHPPLTNDIKRMGPTAGEAFRK